MFKLLNQEMWKFFSKTCRAKSHNTGQSFL